MIINEICVGDDSGEAYTRFGVQRFASGFEVVRLYITLLNRRMLATREGIGTMYVQNVFRLFLLLLLHHLIIRCVFILLLLLLLFLLFLFFLLYILLPEHHRRRKSSGRDAASQHLTGVTKAAHFEVNSISY